MTGKTLEIISQIIVWFENSFRKDSMPLCGSFAKKSKILYQVRQQHNTDCQLIGVQFDSIEFVELMQVLGFTALNSALIQLRYMNLAFCSEPILSEVPRWLDIISVSTMVFMALILLVREHRRNCLA